MIDAAGTKARIEQALHATTCIHSDCVRSTEDIPRPAKLAQLLANDAAALLLRVDELEAELREQKASAAR
jgi:hypothetical protein